MVHLVPEKGHLPEMKKGTYENGKGTLITKEKGQLSKEKWQFLHKERGTCPM